MIGRRVPPAHAPVRPFAWLPSGRGRPRPRLAARLRTRLDAEEVILVGSGTQALRLAVRAAFRLGPGKPGPGSTGAGMVAMPAFTCYDVAAAVLAETPRVTCFDVDPATLAPDPSSLARVLEAGADVLIVSPLYGVPIPWEPVEAAAAAAGAVLIEDAAQGHGASWRGRPVGGLGVLSVVSFGRGKGWTGGGGGAVLARAGAGDALRSLARDIDDASLARGALVTLGALAQWSFGRPALYGVPAAFPWSGLGETIYRVAPDPASMPESAARIALASEESADREAAVRRRRGAWFRRRLDPGIVPQSPPDGVAGELRLPVRVSVGARGLGPEALRLGVSPSYPATLPSLPAVLPALAGPERSWPGADLLARELVTLPTHSLLTRHDADGLLRWIDRAGAVSAPNPEANRRAIDGTRVAKPRRGDH